MAARSLVSPGCSGCPRASSFPLVSALAARAAIRCEATQAVELDRSYDGVVLAAREAADRAGEAALLIQDTSWPGYEQIPEWITDGYSTLFHEAGEQLDEAGAGWPGLVAVPVGVGALAHAAVLHYRSGGPAPATPGGARRARRAHRAQRRAGQRARDPFLAARGPAGHRADRVDHHGGPELRHPVRRAPGRAPGRHRRGGHRHRRRGRPGRARPRGGRRRRRAVRRVIPGRRPRAGPHQPSRRLDPPSCC